MSQASSPGRCCWPMSLIRCGGPSAVRTRTAAKRASSRPLVPFRQLTCCHLALARMSSAAVDNTSGMCRLRGRPRPATGQISFTRINLLVTRDTDGPGQAACREPLTERRAEAVTGIRQHTAKTHTGCHHAIDLRQGDLRLGPRYAVLDGNARPLQRTALLVQLSGTKKRNATMTGTSPRASVSDTNVWQLAVLPRDEAYCAATPTERSPFFHIAVSSMTGTASLPPTT